MKSDREHKERRDTASECGSEGHARRDEEQERRWRSGAWTLSQDVTRKGRMCARFQWQRHRQAHAAPLQQSGRPDSHIHKQGVRGGRRTKTKSCADRIGREIRVSRMKNKERERREAERKLSFGTFSYTGIAINTWTLSLSLPPLLLRSVPGTLGDCVLLG